MKRIRIDVAPAYDVVLGPGALEQLGDQKGRLAVVVDENVLLHHTDRIRAWLSGRRHALFQLPPGEKHKTLSTASLLYDWLAQHRFERGESIVAVGGGVTGDLVGFVAATWRRGVPFVQVPTTLLAQVDASVGGKVAVDHAAGKNLIGAFHQPRQVLADTAFLSTLPERQLWNGLAEVVKTALLAGDPLLSLVEAHLEELARGEGPVEEIVAACVAFKAAVVQRDPHEHGERAILNLGHTVGHALERAGGYARYLHGEAVAHGLRAALALSGHDRTSRSMQLVARLAAPPVAGVQSNELLAAMRDDKKVAGGKQKWVLLDEPGRARWGVELREPDVLRVVDALVAGQL